MLMAESTLVRGVDVAYTSSGTLVDGQFIHLKPLRDRQEKTHSLYPRNESITALAPRAL